MIDQNTTIETTIPCEQEDLTEAARMGVDSSLEIMLIPSEEDPLYQTNTSPRSKLGVLSLSIIVFYNVSGGPFGIETSVRSGGNLFALMGFLLGPLIWSIQEALLTAELGTTFPEAGAGVAWVEEAFGKNLGFICGYLGWVAGATDNAIYPVLFLDYLVTTVGTDAIDDEIRFLFLACTSAALGLVNWRGLPVVGKLSIWICFLAMSPFLVLVVIGSFQVDPKRWFQLANDDDDESGGVVSGFRNVLWRPFLNNLFWNLNSFDAAGSFCGEIDNIHEFPKAMLWSVFLVATCYFFPLLIAIGAHESEPKDWTDGYMATVTTMVVGKFWGQWTVFAAAISNIGLFQAELSADAYQLMGMADRGHLPNIFSRRSRHGTPTFGIILGVLVIILMDFLSDFDQLIEMLNFNYALALLMEYAAFLKLRIDKPHIHRPFKIPLGTLGCCLLFLPSICLTLIVLAFADTNTYIFSICVIMTGILLSFSGNC